MVIVSIFPLGVENDIESSVSVMVGSAANCFAESSTASPAATAFGSSMQIVTFLPSFVSSSAVIFDIRGLPNERLFRIVNCSRNRAGKHKFEHEIILQFVGRTSPTGTVLTSAKTEIAGAETEIAGAETEIAGAETEIAGAETEIAGAGTKISGAELKKVVAEIFHLEY